MSKRTRSRQYERAVRDLQEFKEALLGVCTIHYGRKMRERRKAYEFVCCVDATCGLCKPFDMVCFFNCVQGGGFCVMCMKYFLIDSLVYACLMCEDMICMDCIPRESPECRDCGRVRLLCEVEPIPMDDYGMSVHVLYVYRDQSLNSLRPYGT